MPPKRYNIKALNVVSEIEADDAERLSLQEDIQDAELREVELGDDATVTINVDTTDIAVMPIVSGNITLAAPIGTPKRWQKLLIMFRAAVTKTITRNAIFDDTSDATFETSFTGANKWDKELYHWNPITSKYELLSSNYGA